MRYTKKDILAVQKILNDLIGYNRFQWSSRYNYQAIDEYDKNGKCIRVYKTGMTKSQVFETYHDILTGIRICAEKYNIKL